MDDYLYLHHGVFSFLFELGTLGLRKNPHTWLNPLAWANAYDLRKELENVVPSALYLIKRAAEGDPWSKQWQLTREGSD